MIAGTSWFHAECDNTLYLSDTELCHASILDSCMPEDVTERSQLTKQLPWASIIFSPYLSIDIQRNYTWFSWGGFSNA